MMFTEAKLLNAEGNPVATDEVGEPACADHVCRGYWNNPAATAKVLNQRDDGSTLATWRDATTMDSSILRAAAKT